MLRHFFMCLVYYVKKFWFILVLVIMAVIFTIYAKKKDLLNAYTGGDAEYTMIESEETETELPMEEFTYEGLALTMKIPEGWERVTKDGYDTFIHTPSATSIQLQVMSYYPQVNNVTAESLGADLLAMGYSLTDFSRTSLNSYLTTYQSETSAGVMDYIDFTIWDLSHVVKLHITVQDDNYERIKEPLLASLDSLVWDYEDPIPEGIYINYSINGDFQFGIPEGWTTGEQEGSIYAYDTSGANMSVTLLEDQDPDIDSLTQLDYATFASTGKNNFILSRFEKGSHYIYAEATYSTNNVMMGMMQYYGIYGTSHYIITFNIPYDLISDYYELCYSCIDTFRIFGSAEGTETDETVKSGVSEDLGLNDMLGDVPISSTPQETETETIQSAETGTQPITEDTAKTEGEGLTESVEASSFGDALVQAIGIPAERAMEISNIWDSLAAGNPIYAQAVKESADAYILYIQAEGGMEYYMTVSKDGALKKICVGSEDGQILFEAED